MKLLCSGHYDFHRPVQAARGHCCQDRLHLKRILQSESTADLRRDDHTLLSSSLQIGWTSLLLEHHGSCGRSEAFTTLATPDQTIVIATRSDHEIECFGNGRWRKAVYCPAVEACPPRTTPRDCVGSEIRVKFRDSTYSQEIRRCGRILTNS